MRSNGLYARVSNTLAYSTSHLLSCPFEDTLGIYNLISTLRLCRDKDTAKAKGLHTYVSFYGFDTVPALNDQVVQAYLACSNVLDAQRVFLKSHPEITRCSSSLITGFLECRQLQSAFNLYKRKQGMGDHHVLLALLKSCIDLKAMKEGRELHDDIVLKGYEQSLYIGNTLIDMYMKCGSVIEARSVFDGMCDRNVVSWNALIAGYAESSLREEALCLVYKMQIEGVAVDAVTCISILKACHLLGVVSTGMEVHANIVVFGLEQDLFVGSSLISMYAKCGLLTEATEVFGMLEARDTVSWTALLSGCAEHGAGEEVLKHLEQMREDGISPTPYVYACSLKACGSAGMIDKGREIHSDSVKRGCDIHVHVGSSLVDMYGKHGLLFEGRNVLDAMPVRNTVSWNSLIAGYADYEPGPKALKCREQMHLEQISPDVVTLASCLKSCASARAIKSGQELHVEIIQKGLETDLHIGTALVGMYVNSGFLLEAHKAFDEMAVQNVVSWNVLMAGHVEYGSSQEAFECFQDMKVKGITPSAITLSCVLEACWKKGCLEKGQKVHSEVIEKGFEGDYYIGNVLVNLYAKHGVLADAKHIFDRLLMKSSESWTAMISGYAEHEWSFEAFRCFEQMKSGGVFLDATVYACVLKACGSIEDLKKSQEMLIEVMKKGFEKDPFVGITLVDVYCKCGMLSDGHEIFNRLSDLGVIAWNALISGYTEHGPQQLALECYDAMQSQDVSPSTVTYVSVLKACCKVGAIQKGREIHKDIRQKGYEADSFIASTLILMYAVCGSPSEAWEAFKELRGHSVVSWNAMLKGLGMNHKGDMALCLYGDMQEQGVKPDVITLMCLLAACSRTSLVVDGRKYFQTMMQNFNGVPTSEHLACMVDVLARSGHLHQADKLFESLPYLPSREMWTSLLSACQTYAELDLAKRCFQQLIIMDEESTAPYLLMARIYARKVEEPRRLANLPGGTASESCNKLEQPCNQKLFSC